MHNAKPFMPVYIPLAVKSPYHSTWFKGGDGGGNLATDWPVFWTGEPVGWAGLVRVDGRTWGWMGRGETQCKSVRDECLSLYLRLMKVGGRDGDKRLKYDLGF